MSARVRDRILAVLCLIFGGILIYMLYTAQQSEKEQQALYEEMAAKAKPYEQELSSLETELSSLKKETAYTSDHAKLMVGFVISEISDVEIIGELAKEYGFSPVAIFDCSEEYEDIISLIDSVADTGWERMLTSAAFSDEVNETVQSVLSYLDETKAQDCGVFLLRNDFYNTVNINKLVSDGFVGYTVYSSTAPTDGQDEDGNIYFEYYYVSSETSSLTGKLSYLRSGLSSMIIAIDMAAVNSGEVTDTFLTSVLDSAQEYDGYDDCCFATVAEVVDELSRINEIEAEYQAEYEQAAKEIQERMEELEEIIDGIWSGDYSEGV